MNHQNGQGQTSLMMASAAGYYDVVQLLLDSGAIANILDYTGRSALDWARDGRDQDIIRLLKKAEHEG